MNLKLKVSLALAAFGGVCCSGVLAMFLRTRNQHRRDVLEFVKSLADTSPVQRQRFETRVRRATKEDSPFIARMDVNAMEGWMIHEYGARNVDIVVREFTQLVDNELSLYSYKNTFILEVYDQGEWRLAGSYNGYTFDQKKQHEQETWHLWDCFTESVKRSIPLFDTLVSYYEQYQEAKTDSGYPYRMDEGDYYFSFMSIPQQYRGQGLSAILLDHMENSARSSQCKAVRLDTAQYNQSAKRLYERRGYQVETTHGIPGLTLGIHMIKQL